MSLDFLHILQAQHIAENLAVFHEAMHESDLQKCKIKLLFSPNFLYTLENIVIFHEEKCVTMLTCKQFIAVILK